MTDVSVLFDLFDLLQHVLLGEGLRGAALLLPEASVSPERRPLRGFLLRRH